MSSILSISSQAGQYSVPIVEFGEYVSSVFPDERAGRKFRFLIRDKSIQKKNSVLPDFKIGDHEKVLFTKENPMPSTEERMATFNECALPISLSTANDAINKANIAMKDITHIITVTCTGLSAPGLEIKLIEALGLNNDVQRHAINFMGCYAAFHAFRLADMIVKLNPNAKVLILTVELCSLHFRIDGNDDNLLSTYLFADGVAACIVGVSNHGNQLKLVDFHSVLVPEGMNDMAWEVGNNGFEMVLNKNVPIYLKQKMKTVFDSFLGKNSLKSDEITEYAIHPGGKNILKAFQEALEINESILARSYEILRDNGNMSSSTILFVLEKYLYDSDIKNEAYIYSAAFGPGLTVENGLMQKKIK